MKNYRNRQTREQMKRDRIKTALLVGAMVIGWVVCLHLFFEAWEHPAEQSVDGTVYVASIQMEGDPFEYTR